MVVVVRVELIKLASVESNHVSNANMIPFLTLSTQQQNREAQAQVWPGNNCAAKHIMTSSLLNVCSRHVFV